MLQIDENNIRLMTIREVCDYLNISQRMVYKMMKSGQLKPIKIPYTTGNKKQALNRFDPRDINKLLGEV